MSLTEDTCEYIVCYVIWVGSCYGVLEDDGFQAEVGEMKEKDIPPDDQGPAHRNEADAGTVRGRGRGDLLDGNSMGERTW